MRTHQVPALRRALATALLAAGAAVGAASCEDHDDYLFIAGGAIETSIDMATWTAHVSADVMVEVNFSGDAKVGLDAVRIVERVDDGSEAMEFTTLKVGIVPEMWPLHEFSLDGTPVHIEAEATVPESRRQGCIPTTEISLQFDTVTDYGAKTTSQSLFANKSCW